MVLTPYSNSDLGSISGLATSPNSINGLTSMTTSSMTPFATSYTPTPPHNSARVTITGNSLSNAHASSIQHVPAENVYSSLVSTYKGRVNESTKGEILTSLNGVFNAYLRDHNYADINKLKKMLDVNFSKDVDCKYKYILASTPNSYGCDLRELIFNRDGTTTREGEALLATFQEIASAYNAAQIPKLYHVLTDIDDTLYANRGWKSCIAGSDMSWPQHIAYPGVTELHRQLHSLRKSTHYSTVLSATPGAFKPKKLNSQELKDILGDFSFIQGVEGKREIIRNGPSTLLTGIYRGDNPDGAFYRTIAETKYARFQQYARIFPERQYIWIGDNGQGDEVAGRRMLDQRDVMVTVCIHIVRPVEEGARDPRIIYFNSYGELATKLFDVGLFGHGHVAAVIKSAKAECISTSGTSDAQKAVHCDHLPTRGDMKEMSRMSRSHRPGSRGGGGGGGRRRKRKTLKPRTNRRQRRLQRQYSIKHSNN
jgi:hypothetical protein